MANYTYKTKHQTINNEVNRYNLSYKPWLFLTDVYIVEKRQQFIVISN